MNKLNGFVLACAIMVPAFASAASINGTLTVRAEVGAGCQVNSSGTGTADFGTLDFGQLLSTNTLDVYAQSTGAGSGNIVVECTTGTEYTIALGDGENHDGTNRAMENGSNAGEFLSYVLYQDSGYATEWTTSSPLTVTSDGTEQSHVVYGRIPGGQTAGAGVYTDLVQVTVSW